MLGAGIAKRQAAIKQTLHVSRDVNKCLAPAAQLLEMKL